MRLMGAPHGIFILQGWCFRPCLSWIPSKYGKHCMASSSGNESMHVWCYLVLIFLHRDAVAAARRSVSSSSEMRRWTATGTIFLQHAVTEGKAFGFGCALSTVSFYRKYDGKEAILRFHVDYLCIVFPPSPNLYVALCGSLFSERRISRWSETAIFLYARSQKPTGTQVVLRCMRSLREISHPEWKAWQDCVVFLGCWSYQVHPWSLFGLMRHIAAKFNLMTPIEVAVKASLIGEMKNNWKAKGVYCEDGFYHFKNLSEPFKAFVGIKKLDIAEIVFKKHIAESGETQCKVYYRLNGPKERLSEIFLLKHARSRESAWPSDWLLPSNYPARYNADRCLASGIWILWRTYITLLGWVIQTSSFTSIFHIRTSPLQMMTSILRQILVLHHHLLQL